MWHPMKYAAMLAEKMKVGFFWNSIFNFSFVRRAGGWGGGGCVVQLQSMQQAHTHSV
jgi:hypothetical protein